MTPPVVIGHIEQGERIGDPGMSAHHIDAAELVDAPLDRPTAIVVDRDVTGKRDAPFSQFCGRGLQPVGVVIERDNIRAFIQEALGQGEADALCRTSDDNALAGKTRHVGLQT
jgi:hypothetical protein